MVVARYWLAAALLFTACCLRAGEVVVAVPLSMQPYFLPIERSGLAYDTIVAAFAARGNEVRPLYVSSRKIQKLVSEDSRADCIPMVSPGYEHGWSIGQRVRLLHDFAITRPGVEINSLRDLKRKRVLGFAGAIWYLGDAFRSVMQGNPRYREIDNHRAQVRLLLQGSVEVIVADRLLTSWYADYLRGEGRTDTELVFHDLFDPVAHEFICRSPELVAEFNDGLTQILEDGTLEGILEKYGKKEADRILLPLKRQTGGADPTSTPSTARH